MGGSRSGCQCCVLRSHVATRHSLLILLGDLVELPGILEGCIANQHRRIFDRKFAVVFAKIATTLRALFVYKLVLPQRNAVHHTPLFGTNNGSCSNPQATIGGVFLFNVLSFDPCLGNIVIRHQNGLTLEFAFLALVIVERFRIQGAQTIQDLSCARILGNLLGTGSSHKVKGIVQIGIFGRNLRCNLRCHGNQDRFTGHDIAAGRTHRIQLGSRSGQDLPQ